MNGFNLWQTHGLTNKLVQTESLPFAWSSSHQIHRRHEICLTRLRIGHTRITRTHFLSKSYPLSYEHCGHDSPLTVEHMFRCSALAPAPPPHTPNISFPQHSARQRPPFSLQHHLLSPSHQFPNTYLLTSPPNP